MRVHILKTLLPGENAENAELVYKTIKTGFPTSEVVTWDNKFRNHFLNHADWIKFLLLENEEPFVICDTDMIFYESMESDFEANKNCALFGRFIPQFFDKISDAVTLPRLHPSLMLLNPAALRQVMSAESAKSWSRSIPTTGIEAFYFHAGRRWFSDCMASLSSLCGYETSFAEEQLDKYHHLFCGTFANQHGSKLGESFLESHEFARTSPELCKGRWREQQRYFESLA